MQSACHVPVPIFPLKKQKQNEQTQRDRQNNDTVAMATAALRPCTKNVPCYNFWDGIFRFLAGRKKQKDPSIAIWPYTNTKVFMAQRVDYIYICILPMNFIVLPTQTKSKKTYILRKNQLLTIISLFFVLHWQRLPKRCSNSFGNKLTGRAVLPLTKKRKIGLSSFV